MTKEDVTRLLTNSIHQRAGFMISTPMAAEIAAGALDDLEAAGVPIVYEPTSIDAAAPPPADA